jgi:multidrug resistance efflux pump
MGTELRDATTTWFPRSNRAAQRRRINRMRETFSHAQAVYEEYSAKRPWIPPTSPIPIPPPAPATPIAAVATAGYAVPPVPEPAPVPASVSSTSGTANAAPCIAPLTPLPPAPAQARPQRNWVYVAVVIVTASIASLGVARYKLNAGASPIEVAGLDGTAFEGTIQPTTTFTIAAPGAMIVKQVLVAVGDRVTVGQPLLVTDDREADAAREAAALDVRAAETRLADLQRRLAVVNRTPAEAMARVAARLSTAERDVSQVPTRQWRDSPERAQAAYDQAKNRAERMQKLADQGLIARQEMDDAQIAVRVAQDDLNNALRAASAGTTLRTAQTEQTEVQLQLARAEREQQRVALQGEMQTAQILRDQAAYRLKAAEQRIQASTITATSPGVVVEMAARPGDQVFAGAALARVAVLDKMVAEVEVASSLINALKPGAPARVRLPGLPAVDAAGTIATVNPIPNRNGNHVVAVRFENGERRLLAGQVAEVRFILQ